MKDRALRRHQDFKAKQRDLKNYNSCIGEHLYSEQQKDVNNIEKLKKVCVMSHLDKHTRKTTQKPLQERKHDITMKEQLRAN